MAFSAFQSSRLRASAVAIVDAAANVTGSTDNVRGEESTLYVYNDGGTDREFTSRTIPATGDYILNVEGYTNYLVEKATFESIYSPDVSA